MLDFIVPRHSVHYTFKEYKTIFDYIFFDKIPTSDDSFKTFVNEKLKKDTFYGLSLRVLFYHVVKYLKQNNKDKNEIILFPEYSFPALVNAAKEAGLKVYFYRVDNSLEADVSSVERLCKNLNPLAVVLSQHFGNTDKNSQKIKDLCETYKTTLLEDCAHAFANLITYGDITFYSFGTGKDIVACGGGMIAFDKVKCDALMSHLENIKKTPDKEIIVRYFKGFLPEIIFSSFPFYHLFVFPVFYVMSMINRKYLEKKMKEDDDGFSKTLYVMPQIMHRLLELNLSRSKKWWKKRKKLAKIYKEELKGTLLPSKTFLMAVIKLRDEESKYKIAQKLMKDFIDVRMDYIKFYLPHPLQEKLIYIPTHPFVNKKVLKRIVGILKKNKGLYEKTV
ncbi:MAG: hypothetical protein C0601_05990 [Candidatus Muiribacterium halophilum]|uniref:DegT/DnrJ/EryC1/StrS aminotransferase family protein n=1 Tax=Muiribacterium halophilum TaxID=2053465 RepID=A0A2N5ZGV0_MUIH1|nr:MAG: hypothetical protein C0601_05990 [Candidatus Muirbacterium halophilum]